jgi:hypothetical protein
MSCSAKAEPVARLAEVAMRKTWLLSLGGVSIHFNGRSLPKDAVTRKWLFFVAAMAAPVIFVAIMLGVWLGREFCEWHQDFARNQRIDREHFQRIKLGMRQEDIEEILGGPPGDYRTPVEEHLTVGGLFFEVSRERKERWKGDKGVIAVTFDEEETVCCLDFSPSETVPPSVLWQFLNWANRDTMAMLRGASSALFP